MPWPEVTLMEWRRWFVHACQQDGANISALCEKVGISRPTAYKWLARWKSAGDAGLIDRSRRPRPPPERRAGTGRRNDDMRSATSDAGVAVSFPLHAFS